MKIGTTNAAAAGTSRAGCRPRCAHRVEAVGTVRHAAATINALAPGEDRTVDGRLSDGRLGERLVLTAAGSVAHIEIYDHDPGHLDLDA